MMRKKRLEGTFIGNFLDGTECAQGKIILIEQNKIKKIEKKIQKKLEKINEKNYDTIITSQTKTLKDGDNLSIKWESENIKLLIWDANQEDGDKINLIVNKKIILKNFETKNKKKEISLRLEEGENIIKITAVNTGKSPPNTSQIELIDKRLKHPIITQLKIKKSVLIKLIR